MKKISKKELWLHKNKTALKMVKNGLVQAKKRQFSKNPPKIG